MNNKLTTSDATNNPPPSPLEKILWFTLAYPTLHKVYRSYPSALRDVYSTVYPHAIYPFSQWSHFSSLDSYWHWEWVHTDVVFLLLDSEIIFSNQPVVHPTLSHSSATDSLVFVFQSSSEILFFLRQADRLSSSFIYCLNLWGQISFQFGPLPLLPSARHPPPLPPLSPEEISKLSFFTLMVIYFALSHLNDWEMRSKPTFYKPNIPSTC